jgi:cell pole-organizing protein PopZ
MGDMAKEPSMEEILSSIKRIIAEESGAAVKPAVKAAARSRAKKADTDESLPPSDSAEEVLELTDPVEDEITPAPAVEALMNDETILSHETAAASRTSLAALSALIIKPEDAPSNTLEGLVRDMLRPMLREWLDAHLPELVEKMVAKEIARLTEGRF